MLRASKPGLRFRPCAARVLLTPPLPRCAVPAPVRVSNSLKLAILDLPLFAFPRFFAETVGFTGGRGHFLQCGGLDVRMPVRVFVSPLGRVRKSRKRQACFPRGEHIPDMFAENGSYVVNENR
jgi:hypothetical protein